MLLLGAFVVMLLFWLWIECTPPKGYPPGPFWWPVVGNMPQVATLRRKEGFTHLAWEALTKCYGPLVGLRLGRTRLVIVASGPLLREVSTRDEFQMRPDGFFYRLRAMGKRGGLVFSDGPIWAEQKKFCMRLLRELGLGQTRMEQLITEEAGALVEWFRRSREQPLDMDGAYDISVLNIIWALIAGKRYPHGHPKLQKICRMIDESFRLTDMSGGALNQMPLLRYIAPQASGYRDLSEILHHMAAFLNETIHEHKRSLLKGETRDLIDAILHEMAENNKETCFTDNDLYMICLDLLQAGTDTTSNTFSFLTLYMMMYPEVQQKVHEEINRVIGRHRRPSLSDRNNMPYVVATIQEVQRIANIPPGGVAHTLSQDTSLAGYQIPKDTVVLLLLYGVHMEKSWKDPEQFRPERFLNDEGQLIQKELFMPFGLGRRRCVGEVLAKANLFLFCTFFLQEFQVSIPSGVSMPTIEIKDGVTLSPKPYRALWKARK